MLDRAHGIPPVTDNQQRLLDVKRNLVRLIGIQRTELLWANCVLGFTWDEVATRFGMANGDQTRKLVQDAIARARRTSGKRLKEVHSTLKSAVPRGRSLPLFERREK